MKNIEIEKLQAQVDEIEKRIESGVSREEYEDLKIQRKVLVDKLTKLGIVYVVDDFDLFTPVGD